MLLALKNCAGNHEINAKTLTTDQLDALYELIEEKQTHIPVDWKSEIAKIV